MKSEAPERQSRNSGDVQLQQAIGSIVFKKLADFTISMDNVKQSILDLVVFTLADK